MHAHASCIAGVAMRPLLLALLATAACNPQQLHGDPPPIEEPPFDGGVFSGPQPVLSPVVTQINPPPPLSGGTLTVLADGVTAVASDPDRDQIYVADIFQKK